uniref:Mitochondrial ribosomal protein L33 n=1 Tax=Gorilla gorilla gorilla TaxID=9595 RepID=A0A2I2ZS99_GORGO
MEELSLQISSIFISRNSKIRESETKSPLRGKEKNTLPLNGGLKMTLIYKEKTEGGDTDSEIL